MEEADISTPAAIIAAVNRSSAYTPRTSLRLVSAIKLAYLL
jgi:hypothetical protein